VTLMSESLDAASPLRLTPKGRAMRESLLAAGAVMFGELGYQRTRVSDIVARASTSHGNFYRHFKDKDEILLAILEPLIEEVRRDSRRRPPDGAVPGEADLVESNLAFFLTYAKHRHLLRVMREAASHGGASSSFLELWFRQRDTFVSRTEHWLTRLQRAKLVDAKLSCLDTAEALGSMTEQLAFVKIGLPPVAPKKAEIERMARTCGHIWFVTIFGKERHR
jgi:AcrR family transcriptional regulator